MSSYNRVIIMGNLTRDPEVKQLPSGTTVAELGIAVNDRVKKNNEWVDETCFVDVTLFGRTAEIADQYLRKGNSTLIEGRLKYESWEKDGQKRTKIKVLGDKLTLLGKGNADPAAERVPSAADFLPSDDDDGGWG